MSLLTPRARLLLLKDFKSSSSPTMIDDLRRQLMALPDLAHVDLEQNSKFTVLASVPARNQKQLDRLKALVSEKIKGWQVIEEQDYNLPATF